MFAGISRLYHKFFEPVQNKPQPPLVWWRVAYCSSYNSPPALVIDVYARYYKDALDYAEAIPKKFWNQDVNVKWTKDWEGIQAWILVDKIHS